MKLNNFSSQKYFNPRSKSQKVDKALLDNQNTSTKYMTRLICNNK